MPRDLLGRVRSRLQQLDDTGTGPTDRELLARFAATREEDAFALLVGRHGAMVQRVCRSVLGHGPDADDAYQATFLILARRAGAVRDGEALAGWLHGVARRAALNARRVAQRRRRHESLAEPREPESAASAAGLRELQAILDEEVGRLPARLRGPFVLCCLEGKDRAAAARELSLKEGTVSSRLAQARAVLRDRLAQRGVALAATLAALGVASPGAAAVPVAPSGVASEPVAAITQGVLNAMSHAKIVIATLLALGLGLAWVGAVVLPTPLRPEATARPHGAEPSGDAPPEAADQTAARIASGVYAQAATIPKLKRFDYQARYRYATVLQGVAECDLEHLAKGLSAPVRDGDWFGPYERTLSWDETRLVSESRPGKAPLGHNSRFENATDTWARSADTDGTKVGFSRLPRDPGLWDVPEHVAGSQIVFFEFCYLRLSPEPFRWGAPVKRTCHRMTFFPPDKADWAALPAEPFGGESCDVTEASYRYWTDKPPVKSLRLWTSQATGRVRGVLGYSEERPEFLARFNDYREVSPGVWVPFRETRALYRPDAGKNKVERSELEVIEAKAGRDLSERWAALLPREGDPVQDQRFAAPVDYRHSKERTDDEIRQLADAKHKEIVEGQERFKELVRPLEGLVGKPAPALPADGWVGGKRPDVAGKPYLLHFWATWCGSCKADLPRLKALAAKGLTVVGLHPAGTPAADVEKLIAAEKLGYPTAIGTEERNADNPMVAGFPVGVFPYSVLVDARGRVVAHGHLADVVRAAETEALVLKFAGKPAPALDAARWLNTPGAPTLDGLRGKVVLIDFWGQWCPPCVTALPRVEELHAKYKDRGLAVVGVHSAARANKLDEFLKGKNVTFPVVVDTGKTAERYEVESWPRYVLIDRKGEIAGGFTSTLPTAAQIGDLLGR